MTDIVTAAKAVAKDLGAAFLRRAAFYGVITIMLVAAVAFGIAAGWSLLAAHFDGATASLVVAGLLAGLTAIALLIDNSARARKKRVAAGRAQNSQPDLAPLLIQTFIASVNAGQTLNTRRR